MNTNLPIGGWRPTANSPEGFMVVTREGEGVCLWPQPMPANGLYISILLSKAPELLMMLRALMSGATWAEGQGWVIGPLADVEGGRIRNAQALLNQLDEAATALRPPSDEK